MLKLNSVMIGSEQPEALVEFYKRVFEKDPDWEDSGFVGFGDKGMSLVIGTHDQVKGKSDQPARMMINFVTSEVKEEFERIKEYASKVVAEPYTMGGNNQMMVATLEDPDGNYFQLMTPMETDMSN
jgi:predicted enzyme related to lactoylglutathione lyase